MRYVTKPMGTAGVLSLFAAYTVVTATPASAALSMTFFDSGTSATVTINDNDGNDTNTNAGIINWSGMVGDYDIESYTTNSTRTDNDGNPNTADLFDLNLTSTTTEAAGILTITITEDNFSLGATGQAVVKTDITPTTVQNDLDFHTGYNGATVITQDNLLPSSSGVGSTTVSLTDPFQLSHIASIQHDGGGSTSYDAITTVTRVPVPATVGLLGVGMFGLGFLMRRKKA